MIKRTIVSAVNAALSQSQPTPLSPAALGYDQLSVLEPAPQPDAKASVDHHAYRVAHIPEPTEAGVEEPKVVAWRIGHEFEEGAIVWTYFDSGEAVNERKAEPLILKADHNTIVERLKAAFGHGDLDYDAMWRRAELAESALTAERERSARLREALKDLAEAARNACDARQHPPLTEALFEASAALQQEPKP